MKGRNAHRAPAPCATGQRRAEGDADVGAVAVDERAEGGCPVRCIAKQARGSPGEGQPEQPDRRGRQQRRRHAVGLLLLEQQNHNPGRKASVIAKRFSTSAAASVSRKTPNAPARAPNPTSPARMSTAAVMTGPRRRWGPTPQESPRYRAVAHDRPPARRAGPAPRSTSESPRWSPSAPQHCCTTPPHAAGRQGLPQRGP